MVESASKEKLVSINLLLLYRPNKDNLERTCVIHQTPVSIILEVAQRSKFDRYS
jgi:hypothetical protein